MRLWFFLGGVFLVQEPISTSAVLFEAYRSHDNVWLINLVFSLATLFDIIVGYYLGKFIDKKFGTDKPLGWAKTKLKKFSDFIGENGKIVALLVYSPLIFPFSTILAPWLDISLTEALIYMFIGEVIFWYFPIWLLVLEIKIFVVNPFTALYIIIVVFTLIPLLFKYFSDRKRNN